MTTTDFSALTPKARHEAAAGKIPDWLGLILDKAWPSAFEYAATVAANGAQFDEKLTTGERGSLLLAGGAADIGMASGDGYVGTTGPTVAGVLGVDQATGKRYLDKLVRLGALEMAPFKAEDGSPVARIPERVLQKVG